MQTDTFPILNTQRLRLRQLTAPDAPNLFRLRSSEEYCKFTRMNKYTSMEQIADYIKRMDDSYNENTSIVWTITLSSDDNHMGGVCLFNYSSDGKRAEIGYDLIPEFRGKGFVTEALNAVALYGFNEMGFDVIFADIVSENVKSANVLDKSGFSKIRSRLELDENGTSTDMTLYELLRKI
ncbi:MAG: GNAT family N-acetyltransferase [Oscillospiraceae bacterium]|nr:GNAT family N-acetyltransferase [Oscillospiraceae bacterium]